MKPLSDEELKSWKSALLDNRRVMGKIYQVEDPLRAIAEIEKLRYEQKMDLADVDKFRKLARTYMDERDDLRGQLEVTVRALQCIYKFTQDNYAKDALREIGAEF